ncbi:MAG: AMP-binding protein [Acidimicrobiales bacterium]
MILRPTRPYLLSQLVPAAAERDPSAHAVTGGDDRLDYATLHDRVARLSAALRVRGISPGDRVVVASPKSTAAHIAMHAAMHAGAVAVPIDPRSSASTVDDVLGRIDPAAAFLHPSTARNWPSRATRVLTIGCDPGAGAPHLSDDEVAAAEPAGPVTRTGHDPAYMITTSGSTGRPKSIVHTHRSGLRYAEIAADCYGLESRDRMANVAPFHFDQSTFELYAAPLVGAGVVLVADAVLRFPASVAELVESERVTVWYSVPTILRQLLDRGALSERSLASLRWVIFGGEVFPANDLRRLMQLAPNARFSNAYGPAEVNQCTFHHLDEPPTDGESIPIGVAWGDTACRIRPVGQHDAPQAEERSLGELWVSTATAMAGYWAQPELTDRAFVDEVGPGGIVTRWYRTGDLVERDAHGRLHFLGRLDRQVKVRGVRIELEAVEAALDSIAGVSASAAGLTESGSLGALVETTTVEVDTIRAILHDRLPPSARPEFIRTTTALPRTGSDKVDHAAVAVRIEALDRSPAAQVTQ